MNKTILVFTAFFVLLLGLSAGYWAGYKNLWRWQAMPAGYQELTPEDLDKILINAAASSGSVLNESQREALESLSDNSPAPAVGPKILELLNAPAQGN